MNSRSTKPEYLEKSFTELVNRESELREIRREYARLPAKERAKAAAFSYDASMVDFLFGRALARGEQKGVGVPAWPSGYVALAIDPTYAPALLTVGTVEYQLGRVKEAMQLWGRLLSLLQGTEDLVEIVDKAGDFLLDHRDWANAWALYDAACRALPRVAQFYSGLGYCLGKLGRPAEAVAAHRRAVELEPRNHLWLNDLGFSLMENGQHTEALPILEKAVALAPQDYELARNNLSNLRAILGAPPNPPGARPRRAKAQRRKRDHEPGSE